MNYLYKYHITLFFSLLIFNFLQAQEWIRIYGDNISCVAYSVIEDYDRGYLYGGNIDDNSQTLPKFGWIFKTDINGEVLWDKKIGKIGDVTFVHDLKRTSDNGIILIGSTKKYDPWYDPFIMKLNACGEKEWCIVLSTPYDKDYGRKIVQLPNGNYIAYIAYTGSDPDERIWLVCLDKNGKVLWKKVYIDEDPYAGGEDGLGLIITPDSSILITGSVYYPDLPDTIIKKIRPYLIKTTFDGEKEWSLIWGKNEHIYGQSYLSEVSRRGTIYSVGYHLDNIQYASIFKTNKYSNEIDCYDIEGGMGETSTISWFQDSTLAVGGGWLSSSQKEIIAPIMKIDTMGNMIKMRNLGDSIYRYLSSVVTFDNKLLITSPEVWDGNWDIYAFKFNSDLEYDSIYTQPFVYDSACSHPIISDTITLDSVFVGLQKPKKGEKIKLTVLPNPAYDKIRVVLPDCITTQSQNEIFNVTTWRYKYKGDVPIEIYDVYGQKWHSEVMQTGLKETEITIRTFPPGLYIVRALIEGQAVSGKFIKM